LNSEAHRHPMVIVRGEGIRPFDSYGREYVGGVVDSNRSRLAPMNGTFRPKAAVRAMLHSVS
jgi:hypothetical protein